MRQPILWSIRWSRDLFQRRPSCLVSVRGVAGGYNEDPTSLASGQKSVVSSEQPKQLDRQSTPERVPVISEDGFVYPSPPNKLTRFNTEPSMYRLATHAVKDIERVHTESFAFQEWGEIRKGLTRDYKDLTGSWVGKLKDGHIPESTTYDYHPGYGDFNPKMQPYDGPEIFRPLPRPDDWEVTWRTTKPVPRRHNIKVVPAPSSWRVEPIPIPMRYLRDDELNAEGNDPTKDDKEPGCM